jgi:hypothetical protein
MQTNLIAISKFMMHIALLMADMPDGKDYIVGFYIVDNAKYLSICLYKGNHNSSFKISSTDIQNLIDMKGGASFILQQIIKGFPND